MKKIFKPIRDKNILAKLKKKGVEAEFDDQSRLFAFVDDKAKFDQELFDTLKSIDVVCSVNLMSFAISDRQLSSLILSCSGLRQLHISESANLTSASISTLCECNKLVQLTLQKSSICEQLLKELPVILSMRAVDFSDSEVSNRLLKLMATKFPSACELRLWRTGITNAGLVGLSRFSDLIGVDLNGCRLTDESFRFFKKLPHLQLIQLRNTSVTLEAAKKFAIERPKCVVVLGDGWDDIFLNDGAVDLAEYSKKVDGA